MPVAVATAIGAQLLQTLRGTPLARGRAVSFKLVTLCSALAGCAIETTEPERVDVSMQLAELPGLAIYFHRYLSDRLWNPSGNSFSADLSYRLGDLLDEEHGIAGCAHLDDSLT